MPEEHQLFLDECLIGKKEYYVTKENVLIYREIFHMWQEVCFPQNRSTTRSVDVFLLGHLLRAERLKLCMSVKKVSDLVNISPKTLYSYEEGIRLIKLDILYKVSQIFDFNIDALLKGVIR